MIKLKNINLNLGDFSIKNYNLNIKKGEYFVILGPSGSGKTVLLEIIAGLKKPDLGDIIFNDENINFLPTEKRNIGMVYQEFLLFPHLSVEKNILFGTNFKKINNIKIKYKKILEILDIENLEKRKINNLSGGEKQRIAIARTLITEPKILLLDEPLSSVDTNTKNRLKTDLKKIHKDFNTTTIHVTHDFEEAIFLADKIAVVNNGEIIQVGKPDEIFSTPNSDFVANFIGCKNIFSGKNIEKNIVKINDRVSISVILNNQNDVTLIIKSENIIISKEKIKSSAKNSFLGKVININKKLSIVEVTVDIGIELSVYITYSSYENMELKLDDIIFTTFKATSVHFF